jgi:ribonuclease P protein component
VGPCGPVTAAQEGAQAPHRSTAVQAPESLTGERFPRRVRLARSAELTACWEEGRRWRTTHLELAWRPNQAGHPRVAFVVPRFQFTAVARNRLRRRLREVLRRETLATLPPVDLVVRTKRVAYAATPSTLRAELADGVRHLT